MQAAKKPTDEAAASDMPSGSSPQSTIKKVRKTPGVHVVMSLLPESYEPSQHDVICGRGRQSKNWAGNCAYRQMIHDRLNEYSAAEGKNAKGDILESVIHEVRCKSGLGGFIKKDEKTGRWYEVGDFLAREKTSQCFRDALHDQYTSSAQAKYKRRKLERENFIASGSQRQTKTESASSPFTAYAQMEQTLSEREVSAALQGLVAIKPTSQTQVPILGRHGSIAGNPSYQQIGQLWPGLLEIDTLSHSAAESVSWQQRLSALRAPQYGPLPTFPLLPAGRMGSLNDPFRQLEQDLGMGHNTSSLLSSFAGFDPSTIQRQVAEKSAYQTHSNDPIHQQRAAIPIVSGMSSCSEDAATRKLIDQLSQSRRNDIPEVVRQLTESKKSTTTVNSCFADVLHGTAAPSRSRGINASLRNRVDMVAAPIATVEDRNVPASFGKVQVCAVQLNMRKPGESILESTQNAIRKIEAVVNERRNNNQDAVDLFVLPELSPVGYNEDTFQNLMPSNRKIQDMYREVDVAFASTARKLQTYICYGTIGWNDTGYLFIRQNLMDFTGALVAEYDKIHPCDYGDCAETRFFTAGSAKQKPVFSIHGIRFGILICADMRFPNLCQRLVRDEGVDVLLQPAAFARDCSFRTWRSFRETRAVENSVYFVGVNYAGKDYGETSICPPWVDEENEPLVLETEEDHLIATIERSVLSHVRSTMPFYKHLIQGTCCFNNNSEPASGSERSSVPSQT